MNKYYFLNEILYHVSPEGVIKFELIGEGKFIIDRDSHGVTQPQLENEGRETQFSDWDDSKTKIITFMDNGSY